MVCLRSDGGQGALTSIAADGSVRPGWPVAIDGYVSVLVADDGTVYASTETQTNPLDPATTRLDVQALGPDGLALPGFPIRLAVNSSVSTALAPDGTLFVWFNRQVDPNGISGVKSTTIEAIGKNGKLKAGWPRTINAPASLPAFGPDGTVYVTTGSTWRGDRGSVLALAPNGRTAAGWPVQLPAGMHGIAASHANGADDIAQPPVIGPDGTVYVAITGSGKASILALDASGRELPGWPYDPGSMTYDEWDPLSPPIPGATGLLYIVWNDEIVAIGPDGRVAPGWPQSLPLGAGADWFAAMPDGGLLASGVAFDAAFNSTTVFIRYLPDGMTAH